MPSGVGWKTLAMLDCQRGTRKKRVEKEKSDGEHFDDFDF